MAKKQNAIVKGPNGGPRKGAGRRPGAATRVTRRKADELCESKESPLDIMVDNMLFWYRSVKQIEASLSEILVNLDAGDPDQRAEFLKMLKQFMAARENAQKCAVDAAPYVHPRLAAIQFKGEMTHDVQKILGTMTAQEAGEAYADTLKAGKPA